MLFAELDAEKMASKQFKQTYYKLLQYYSEFNSTQFSKQNQRKGTSQLQNYDF